MAESQWSLLLRISIFVPIICVIYCLSHEIGCNVFVFFILNKYTVLYMLTFKLCFVTYFFNILSTPVKCLSTFFQFLPA